MPAERFGLDSNVLVYLVESRDPTRQFRARDVVDRAAATGRCTLSVQNLGEFYTVAVRKRLTTPAVAGQVVGDLLSLFPTVSPTVADVRLATADAVTGRLAYWDALLLATLGRAGCTVVLSEDMHDRATFAGVIVRNPFVGDALPDDLGALLT